MLKLLETQSFVEVQFVIGNCRFISQSNYLNNSNNDCDWLILACFIHNPSNIFARARLVSTRHLGEYSPAKTGEYPRMFPNFRNCARCVKDLKDNKDNSLHLGRKYARIFVLGHYLFLVAHSFPRATLSENCSLLGTDNVSGQIS